MLMFCCRIKFFALWQHKKNILRVVKFVLSRCSLVMFFYCTKSTSFNDTFTSKWAAPKQQSASHTLEYITHMVSTEVLLIKYIYTKYCKYFCGFLNLCLPNSVQKSLEINMQGIYNLCSKIALEINEFTVKKFVFRWGRSLPEAPGDLRGVRQGPQRPGQPQAGDQDPEQVLQLADGWASHRLTAGLPETPPWCEYRWIEEWRVYDREKSMTDGRSPDRN